MSFGADDADIMNYIKSLGIAEVVEKMDEDDKSLFIETMKEIRIQKEFRDFRFAELETLSDMATIYKVKDFEKLTSLENRTFLKFMHYMLFKNRIIKLYPEEYNALPADIKTILYEDVTFHDRLRKSLIIKPVEE